ncbi:MAG: cation:proton antiporter [Spirochaetes bacterium]|nr:cation:proton antiporter [Spirochaetota bacterium]
MGIAEDIIIIIIAGLIAALVAHKMKLPPMVGYIVAGIFIGPFTGGVTVTHTHQIELLAEIGVALLLFSIGLDLSFKEIKEVRSVALIGTTIQLTLAVLFGYGIGRLAGLAWAPSLLLGGIVSLSSTMIVIKTLMSRGLMGTLSSKVMIGMLIVQDLAAVPMMIFIPRMNAMGESIAVIGLTLLKGAVVLVLIFVIGTRLIPFILKLVSRLNSSELFLLSVAALGLGVGYATYVAGLSFALGAFVTGMVLSESDYSHKALSDIIPLRDIFGLLFFTSIGMLIDPWFIIEHATTVLGLVGIIIVAKFVLFAAITRAFGYINVIPLAVGLGLSQVGEFSFVLARIGVSHDIMTKETYSIVLSASVVTMLLSPFLTMLTSPLYSLSSRVFKREKILTSNFPGGALSGHVIIAGGGRVGYTTASILHTLRRPFVIIEQDFHSFERSKQAGFPIIYGDASSESVLTAAHIQTSRLLLITIPSIMTSREIIGISFSINRSIHIVARGNNMAEVKELHAMNVQEVVQPEFEASLEMMRQAMLRLDIPALSIQKYTDDIRRLNYAPRPDDSRRLLDDLKKAPYLLEMEWFNIKPESPAAGKSIGDLKIRSATGATVVGIYRNNKLHPNPDFDFIFQPLDIVGIIGQCENRLKFEEMIDPDARHQHNTCEEPGGMS